MSFYTYRMCPVVSYALLLGPYHYHNIFSFSVYLTYIKYYANLVTGGLMKKLLLMWYVWRKRRAEEARIQKEDCIAFQENCYSSSKHQRGISPSLVFITTTSLLEKILVIYNMYRILAYARILYMRTSKLNI